MDQARSVEAWFGDRFAELHPLLQDLHRQGGTLRGEVTLQIAKGLRGVLGRVLARKLRIPIDRPRLPLEVQIFQDTQGLRWNRCFDGCQWVNSLFVPLGTIDSGYWLESTGPVRLALTVQVREGAWYWEPLRLWIFGVRFPLGGFIRGTAFKRVQGEHYHFYVGLAVPLLGTGISYSGALKLDPDLRAQNLTARL